MNIILIRKVKKDDAQAIADAFKIAYIPLFQTQKLSQSSIDEQLLLNDSYHLAERFKGNYFYVAKDSKEKVVGLIGLRKNDEGTVYDRISTFFVLPEQRGKGVGKLLFKTVCDLALCGYIYIYNINIPHGCKSKKARTFLSCIL